MFAELLRNSPLLVFPIVGLGLFATLYAAVVATVFARKSNHYRRMAELPLDREGDGHE